MNRNNQNKRPRNNNRARRRQRGGGKGVMSVLQRDNNKIPRVFPNSFPSVYFCKQKYTSQVGGLSNAVSNFATQIFYVNSVYRPEATGTDISNAIGFTELATIYNTYLVYEAVITLRISNEEALRQLCLLLHQLILLRFRVMLLFYS